MIKIFTILVALTFSSLQEDVIRDIGIAMKSGSAKELSTFFNKTVEIRLEGKSANYSKSQAEVVLKEFFDTYPANDFTYTVNFKKGSSSENLKYTIGLYSHDKGAFLVVMLIKKIDDAYLIDTLNFTPE